MIYMNAMASIVHPLTEWLGVQSLYTGLVALVIWGIIHLCRIRHPAWQLALWWLVLLRLLLPLSFATPVSLRSGVELVATSLVGSHETLQNAALKGWQPTASGAVSAPGTAASQAAKSVPQAKIMTDILLSLILLGWVTGVTLLSLRAVYASRQLRRWLATADEVQDPAIRDWVEAWRCKLGVRRPVRLITSDRAASFTTGLWHPVIHLPRALVSQGDAVTLDAVIGHEMAHIHGLDAFFYAIERSLAILFFFHPAVWFAVERIAVARESLRDALVVERGEANVRDYFAGIISAVRCMRMGDRQALPPSLAIASLGRSAAHLRERILWLKQARHSSQAARMTAIVGVGIVAIMLLPMAHADNRPRHASSTAPARPTAPLAAPATPATATATKALAEVTADDNMASDANTDHEDFSEHAAAARSNNAEATADDMEEGQAEAAQQQAAEAGQNAAEAAQQAVQASQEAAQAAEAATTAMRDVHVALAEARRTDHNVHVDIDVDGIHRAALLAASAGLKAAAEGIKNAHLAENINRNVAQALHEASRQVAAARDQNRQEPLGAKIDADIRAALDQAARELEQAANDASGHAGRK